MSTELTQSLERKTRQIHELIESKQYKKALKQCNTFLKKSDHPILVAMKAYIHQRLGEDEESFRLLEEVVSHKPLSPNLLDLVTIIYKALNRYDRLNQLHSESFAKNPTRETGEMLFNSYASVFNFTEQYQIAMKLYKTFADVKYGILAVESMCLIAMHEPGQKKLLDLATMFFNKIKLNKEFVASREMVELEVFIEHLKEKDLEVLRLLRNHRDVLEDAIEEEAEIESKLGDHVKAANLMASLFNPGELTPSLGNYLKYVEFIIKTVTDEIIISLSELCESNIRSDIVEGGKPAVLSAYGTFTELMQVENSSKNFKRTVNLAKLNLLTLLISKKYTEEDVTSFFVVTLENYIREYSDIPSVIEDIKEYLKVLPEPHSSTLMTSLADLLQPSSADHSKSLAYLKLCYKFGRLPEHSLLFSMYQEALGRELPPKKGEHRLGDQLIMMIVRQYPRASYFTQILLEYAIPQSQYNYFLKLQLISNYSATEFCKKIYEVYESLDIKSVQHESLSHLVFGELNDWRLWRDGLGKLCNSVEKFHRYYALDLAESTNLAYTHHHIEQILDFSRFKYVVDNSLYFHMTQISVLYIELAKKMQEGMFKMNTEFIHRELACFTDTTDMNVMNDYSVITDFSREKEKEKCFGRWTDLKFFDFERYLVAFVCEICAESARVEETLGKIQGISREITDPGFYPEAYRVLLNIAEIFVSIKAGRFDGVKETIGTAANLLRNLVNTTKDIRLFSSFREGLQLDHDSFITGLKSIAFVANTFIPVAVFVLNACKKRIPEGKSSKKNQKNPITGIQDSFKLVISNIFLLLDESLGLLQNEDFLAYIDADESLHKEIGEIILMDINKSQKISEIVQARRVLIKEICLEIHSVRAATSSLLRGS